MMWSETAEQLKHELTDKYVVVMDGVPELKRFAGRTGTVKTVNMSGRALVQFEAPADISWYDIDPTYLTVIDAPLPKKKAAEPAAPAKSEKAAPKPAGKAKGGLSPLELARQQGAGGGGAAKPAAPADGGKKLSPLELARQQGAAGGGSPAAEATAPAQKAESSATAKLSPLELARQQGAAKAGEAPAAPPAEEKQAPVVDATPPEEEVKTESPTPAAAPADTSGMSKLELARQQGAFKG